MDPFISEGVCEGRQQLFRGKLIWFFFRISPKPHILIGHFFAVAVYAVYTTFRAEKWWAAHKATLKSSLIFYKACMVLFPLMWSELKTMIK